MASFSGGVKAGGKIALTASGAGSISSWYTVPAASYLLFNIYLASSSGELTIDGDYLIVTTTVFQGSGFVAGPGAVIGLSLSGTSPYCAITGVILENT